MHCTILFWKLHCKKWLLFFPSPARMSRTKLSLAGNFPPARESLVSDIPAGDGKNDYLFYSVKIHADFRENLILLTVCQQQDASEIPRKAKISKYYKLNLRSILSVSIYRCIAQCALHWPPMGLQHTVKEKTIWTKYT
jgi:hypothetical protein